MELADALGLHHVVVNVAHGDGVGGVGVGVRGLARISHVSSKVNEQTQGVRPKAHFGYSVPSVCAGNFSQNSWACFARKGR